MPWARVRKIPAKYPGGMLWNPLGTRLQTLRTPNEMSECPGDALGSRSQKPGKPNRNALQTPWERVCAALDEP
eukprot:775640-Lingulodinium_polyedra.AAC.1